MRYFLAVTGHFIFTILILQSIGFALSNEVIAFYTIVFNVFLCVTISIVTFGITKRMFLNDKINPSNKAVLITGCDSGFGHQLAKRLDSKGFHVFASCLSLSGTGPTSLKESCSPRLKVLELNVTKDDDVNKAVEFVKANLGYKELWAIVNNAGLHVGLSVELSGVDEFKDAMEVNAIGPVRVTKAFLPLLKQSKGRVINLTSVGGRTILADMTPYLMSKHAATAFSDCLRQELDGWRIKVISVEPGPFATNMVQPERADELLRKAFDPVTKTVETKYDEKIIKVYRKKFDLYLSITSPRIELVVDDLESAITLKYPASTYLTLQHLRARFIMWIHMHLPIDMRDFSIKVLLFLIERLC